jgi:putative transposase
MPWHRWNARLALENYLGRRSYFVTICCDFRRPYLEEVVVAQGVVELLLECAAGNSFQLHAFCLMPDHLHMLAEGGDDRCNLLEFIRVFKLRTAFAFRKSHGRRLWEMSSYEHILRRPDSVEAVATYIWWNPVRRGLCERAENFPFSGSQTVDWRRRCSGGSLDPSVRLPWIDRGRARETVASDPITDRSRGTEPI